MNQEEKKRKHREYMNAWNSRNRKRVREIARASYQRNKENRIQRVREYKIANPRKVKMWSAEYRERNSAKIAAYNAANRDMQSIRSKRRYEKNKELILSQQKILYQDNKEAILKRNAVWREKNKDHYRKQQREYKRQRLISDPAFRLKENYSRRIHNALHGIGMKSAKTIELLGCDGEFLKSYLEKKFTEGMTWENYGQWHVDHIKPLASFDLLKEQKQAFHYTNLQPLWAKDNRKKWAN